MAPILIEQRVSNHFNSNSHKVLRDLLLPIVRDNYERKNFLCRSNIIVAFKDFFQFLKINGRIVPIIPGNHVREIAVNESVPWQEEHLATFKYTFLLFFDAVSKFISSIVGKVRQCILDDIRRI